MYVHVLCISKVPVLGHVITYNYVCIFVKLFWFVVQLNFDCWSTMKIKSFSKPSYLHNGMLPRVCQVSKSCCYRRAGLCLHSVYEVAVPSYPSTGDEAWY